MSEPRKSRREAKLTQRFKEFLGEDSTSVKSHTPSKVSQAGAKHLGKQKEAAKKDASKASAPSAAAAAPKKAAPKTPATAAKAFQGGKTSPVVMAPAKTPTKVQSDTTPKASTSTVTQSVRKTSIKEAKKIAAAVKAKNATPESDVMRTKRVPKPSAKVAEALETEAALIAVDSSTKKSKAVLTPKLTPSAKLVKVIENVDANIRPGAVPNSGSSKPAPFTVSGSIKPAPSSVSDSAKSAPASVTSMFKPSSSVSGSVKSSPGSVSGNIKPIPAYVSVRGRGRGATGVRGGGVGRGRWRGRGRPPLNIVDKITSILKVQEPEEMKSAEEEEDEPLEMDSVEGEDSSELDETLEGEGEMLDEEDEDSKVKELDEEQMKVVRTQKVLFGNVDKKTKIVKAAIDTSVSSQSKGQLGIKKVLGVLSGKAQSPISATKNVVAGNSPLSGASLSPIVKKGMVNYSSPVKIATQVVQHKEITSEDSPGKVSIGAKKDASLLQDKQAVSKVGVKRVLVSGAADPSQLKKIKLTEKPAALTTNSSCPTAKTSTSSVSSVSVPLNLKAMKHVKAGAPVKLSQSADGSVTVVTPVSASTANGVTQKMTVKGKVGRPPGSKSAGTQALKGVNTPLKSPGAAGSCSDGDTRRSRRQPKPTERMKEFLHRSSEEEPDDITPDDNDDIDDHDLSLDDDDEDIPEDTDSEDEEAAEKANRVFLNMIKKASSSPKTSSPKRGVFKQQQKAGMSNAKAHQLIKTQVVQVHKGGSNTNYTPRFVEKKIIPAVIGQPTKVVQVKTEQFSRNVKVAVNKPNTINGDARKVGSAVNSNVKITTAGGPKKPVMMKPVNKLNEPPIIIKVRTLDPQEEAERKSKLQEDDKKLGPRKVIKVDTQAGKVKKDVLDKRRDSSKDDSESMPSEEETDDQMEEEEEMEDEQDDAAINENEMSDRNKKLLNLCKDAIQSLKERARIFKEAPGSNANKKILDKATLNKFIHLSEEISDTIKRTIEEEGDTISEADNFEEYCQDVLDSITVKGDEDDLTQEEGEKILLWLNRKENLAGSSTTKKDTTRESQMMLYTQILELLTGANEDRGDTFDEEVVEEEEDELDDDMNYDDNEFSRMPQEYEGDVDDVEEEEDVGDMEDMDEEHEDDDVDVPSVDKR